MHHLVWQDLFIYACTESLENQQEYSEFKIERSKKVCLTCNNSPKHNIERIYEAQQLSRLFK